jgi:D-alanyl-D-alanine carboxypeptidase
MRWNARMKALVTAIGLLFAAPAAAQTASIASYLRPYVATNNFSGAVLVERGGRIVFAHSYGFADRETRVPNNPHTRFHIASMSMQFTSAAIMRLVEQGRLSLDTRVSAIVTGVPNGDRITVRNLLEENSGLPDVNTFDNYSALLKSHQTPQSLVAQIAGKTPAADPGGASQREEHSAFNVLALIIEKTSHQPFAAAMTSLVFAPLGMRDSGIDDDTPMAGAHGYEPDGVLGLKPSDAIHWSAKSGNASAYSSVADERKWLDAFLGDTFLKATSRATMLDYTQARVGYGWFKNVSKRFGEPVYSMNGRAPGFSSAIVVLPDQKTTVVVLSNVYISVTTQIGLDIAAIATGRPYTPARIATAPLDSAQRQAVLGRFTFGPDFFQPGATVAVTAMGPDLFLDWPDGSRSPLLPVDATHFIDRSYWEDVAVTLGADGKPSGLSYDRFQGKSVAP